MKQLPISGLKGCPCMKVPLCSSHVALVEELQNVSKGHIFPKHVLAAITLVWGTTGNGGARARARCEPEFLICSVRAPDPSQSAASVNTNNSCPHPIQMLCWLLLSQVYTLLSNGNPLPRAELHQSQRGQRRCSAWARVCTGVVTGN